MSSYTRQQLEDWIYKIKMPAMVKVLDVGGSQNPVKDRLHAKGEGSEYIILDLEKPHECKQKPDIKFDLNCLWPSLFQKKDYKDYFDTAFCIEVMEYIWNPIQALKNICNFLKQGGTLYISFHFIYPLHNPTEQDYLRYTVSGVEKLMEEAGFHIQTITPRLAADKKTLMDWYRSEFMRPAKDYDVHDWVGCLVKAKKI